MVLPIRDLQPTRRIPHVNWLVIAVNLGVFAWQYLALTSCDQARFLYRFAAIPVELLRLEALSPGATEAVLGSCATPQVDKLVLVSVLTSMFLHADLFHLAGNMLFLYVFGDNVEDRLGPVRYVLFYAAGGGLAVLAHVLLRPGSTVPLVGASGAVAAILGAYLILAPRARVLTYVPFPLYLLAWLLPGVRMRAWFLIFAIMQLPAWLLIGGWVGVQFASWGSPAAAGVAVEAHIAGFAAGMGLLLVLDRSRRRRGRQPFHPTAHPPGHTRVQGGGPGG